MCTSSSSGTRCSLRIYLSDTVVQGSEMQVCSSKVCVGEHRGGCVGWRYGAAHQRFQQYTLQLMSLCRGHRWHREHG